MKKALLFLTFGLGIFTGRAQSMPMWYYTIDFDDTTGYSHLTIDSAGHPGNTWQIGMPQKPIFNVGYLSFKAIVTDTLNPYPVNDTSYFTVNNPAGQGWDSHDAVDLYGYYWVDSDSLTDYGTMEISLDNGGSWINLLHDPVYASHINWGSPVPVLTGQSGVWQFFYVTVSGLKVTFDLHTNDPVLWRFDFVSDGIDNGRDGLMYDDLHFDDNVENIPEYERHDLITIYPNPVSNELHIQKANASGTAKIQVYNSAGKMVMENSTFNGNKIDVHRLQNGIYLLRYSSGNQYQVQRFVA